MGSLGDLLIPAKVFPGIGSQTPTVSIVKFTNDLENVEISEKWVSFTECEFTFNNLPVCIWGHNKSKISIQQNEINLSNKNSINLKHLIQGKDINVQIKFNDLCKELVVPPLIRGEITLDYTPTPTFEINSEKCEIELEKSNGEKVNLNKRGIKFIVNRNEYQRVENPEKWTLKILYDQKVLHSEVYDIQIPPLSFYELELVTTKFIIQNTRQDGFFVDFECIGWPPDKGDFNGVFTNMGGKTFDAPVRQGKGRIILKVEDFDYDSQNLLPFFGNLLFKDFNKEWKNIELDMGSRLEIEHKEEVKHLSKGDKLIAWKSEKWPGSMKAYIDATPLFGKNIIDIIEFPDSCSGSYTIENLRKEMPILNQIFRTQNKVDVHIELLAYSNEDFGKKIFTTSIVRKDTYLDSKSGNVYKQDEYEEWIFHFPEEYYPEPSKLKLVYSDIEFEQITHDGSNVAIFGVNHPNFQQINKDSCWKLLYDDMIVVEGSVSIHSIDLINAHGTENFVILDNKSGEFHFSDLGNVEFTHRNEWPNAKLEMELEIIFDDEEENIAIGIGPVMHGDCVSTKITQMPDIQKTSFLAKFQNYSDGEILGKLNLRIPSRDRLLVKSKTIKLALIDGMEIWNPLLDWLEKDWGGKMDGPSSQWEGEMLTRVWMILVNDLEKVCAPGIIGWKERIALLNETCFGHKIPIGTDIRTSISIIGQWRPRWASWNEKLGGNALMPSAKTAIERFVVRRKDEAVKKEAEEKARQKAEDAAEEVRKKDDDAAEKVRKVTAGAEKAVERNSPAVDKVLQKIDENRPKFSQHKNKRARPLPAQKQQKVEQTTDKTQSENKNTNDKRDWNSNQSSKSKKSKSHHNLGAYRKPRGGK